MKDNRQNPCLFPKCKCPTKGRAARERKVTEGDRKRNSGSSLSIVLSHSHRALTCQQSPKRCCGRSPSEIQRENLDKIQNNLSKRSWPKRTKTEELHKKHKMESTVKDSSETVLCVSYDGPPLNKQKGQGKNGQ